MTTIAPASSHLRAARTDAKPAQTPQVFTRMVGDVVATAELRHTPVDIALAGPFGSRKGYTSLDAARDTLGQLTRNGTGRAVGILRHDDRYFGAALVQLKQGASTPDWSPFQLAHVTSLQGTNDPADNDQLLAVVDAKTAVAIGEKADPDAAKAAKLMRRLVAKALPGAKFSQDATSPNTLSVVLPDARTRALAEATFAPELDGLKLQFSAATKGDAGKPLVFGDLIKVLERVPNLSVSDEDGIGELPLAGRPDWSDDHIWTSARRAQDLWMGDAFNSDHIWMSDEPDEM